MALSTKTKTAISQTVINAKDDLYPDREATPNASGGYDIRDVGATVARLLTDEIPTTTKDMSRLYKWESGDKVYGTFAKADKAMTEYRRDIERGKDFEYKDVYIDTTKQVSKEFEKFKRKK